MAERVVEIHAPSRLHFGMFSFGQADLPQFGGVGLMVDSPGLVVRMSTAPTLATSGPLAQRAAETARRVAEHFQCEPRFRIEVVQAPRAHVGLGSGTQLGMAIAQGVCALQGIEATAEQLAAACGRGRRSAIGVYGFAQGGLLVEGGKLPGVGLSPLVNRVELPAAWRFLLLIPREVTGLHGDAEQRAFEHLPPVERAVTAQLEQIVHSELIPAANAADFARFAAALQAFNHLAGECFKSVQGGPYEARAARIVASLRQSGIVGYAQTSWGPTIAVPFASATAAEAARVALQAEHDLEGIIAAPQNRGARVIVT